MKNNRFYALAGFLGLVITTLVVSNMASAHQGDPNVQGPNFDSAIHESMLEAIDNKDYDAWAELHDGRGRVAEAITADNFDRFTEMHDLMMAGDQDGAQKIREELGLGQGRMGRGMHTGGERRGSGDCIYNK